MKDNKIIKSYVWHKEKCFFLSTIERDSSALEPMRFNETLVWEYDWDKRERGKMLYQGEDIRGFIDQHIDFCRQLFETGEIKEARDE
jgi:hypothetical protein